MKINVSKSKKKINKRFILRNNDKKSFLLVIDIGTFCDFKMMDNAIRYLRQKYKIVYITPKSHKLQEDDIVLKYNLSKEILENISNLSSILSEKSVFEKIGSLLKENFFLKEYFLMTHEMVTLMRKAINKYNPKGIVSHYGCLGQLLMLNRLDIPTSILHFAPGSIPNENIPFVFDNILSNKNVKIDLSVKDKKRNLVSCLSFQNTLKIFYSISHSLNFMEIHNNKILNESQYTYLSRMNHINTFSGPLIPKLKLYNKLPKLRMSYLGILEADLPKQNLGKLWSILIDKKKKGKRILFFSMGSFLSKLMNKKYKNTSFLKLLMNEIIEVSIKNNIFVLFHDDGNILSNKYKKDIYERKADIEIINTFISYTSIVPECDFVCFSGSLCLQNVCWRNECPFLILPILDEQYFWAKLYEHHTGISFIDINNYEINNFYKTFDKFLKGIKLDSYLKFMVSVKKSIPKNISKDIYQNIVKFIKES